jgi:hypothetical protein
VCLRAFACVYVCMCVCVYVYVYVYVYAFVYACVCVSACVCVCLGTDVRMRTVCVENGLTRALSICVTFRKPNAMV